MAELRYANFFPGVNYCLCSNTQANKIKTLEIWKIQHLSCTDKSTANPINVILNLTE